MFLKNRNISSKIKRSKVTDYAALREFPILKRDTVEDDNCLIQLSSFDVRNFSAFWLRHWCVLEEYVLLAAINISLPQRNTLVRWVDRNELP